MNEDLEANIRLCLEGLLHRLCEPLHCLGVIVLCVHHVDDGATTLKDLLRVESGVKEVNLAGEVPHGELDEGGVADLVLDDLRRAFEEEGLVGGHLVEDNLLDGGLAAAAEAHQEDLGELGGVLPSSPGGDGAAGAGLVCGRRVIGARGVGVAVGHAGVAGVSSPSGQRDDAAGCAATGSQSGCASAGAGAVEVAVGERRSGLGRLW